MQVLSIIFDIRPVQWGLRGDPFLWEEMRAHFVNIRLPYTQKQFEQEFYLSFKALVGVELGSAGSTYVARFVSPHLGMSKGQVSHKFWADKALPLLLSRLDTANANCLA